MWQETFALSFISAVEKDASYHKGWGFPLAVRGVAATRPTVLLDKRDDGVSCASGQPLSGETPPHVDIESARVSANPETDATDFVITLTSEDTIEAPFFGGIEFFDPSVSLSPPNPNWAFDGIGNLNFLFQRTPEGLQPDVIAYDDESGWTPQSDFSFSVGLDGNTITATIPNPYIPPDSMFYISVTDLENCDSVGLDGQRKPTAVIPPLELEPVLTPSLVDQQDTPAATSPPSDATGGATTQVFSDAESDVMACPGGQLLDDPVADLIRATLEYDVDDPNEPLNLQVYLADFGAKPSDDYSFAVRIDMKFEGETQQAYLYQYHAGDETIGQVDPQTQAIIPSNATIQMMDQILDGAPTTALDLNIPRGDVPLLDEIPIIGYHMATAESARSCDELIIFLQPAIIPLEE
jgi:hypothetical protein